MLKAEAQGRVVFFQKMQQKERRVELGHLSSNIRFVNFSEKSPRSRMPLDKDQTPGELRFVKREK